MALFPVGAMAHMDDGGLGGGEVGDARCVEGFVGAGKGEEGGLGGGGGAEGGGEAEGGGWSGGGGRAEGWGEGEVRMS